MALHLSPAPEIAATGLDRVLWVRIANGGSGVRCAAHGIRHRRPDHTPISLATALKLKAAGVPTVVHGERS